MALGKKLAQVALCYGGNDLVGTAFSEEIFKAAGKSNQTSSSELKFLVKEIGRNPVQRDTFFNIVGLKYAKSKHMLIFFLIITTNIDTY